MKYKVTFEFLNGEGKWVKDSLSNNGKGFTHSDAKLIANQIRNHDINTRNLKVEEV